MRCAPESRARSVALALAIGMHTWACSLIGSGPSQPDGLPHGGTGPFRLLEPEEIDVSGPSGSTLNEPTRAVESGMVGGEHLFYAGAPLIPRDGGMPDAGAPDGGPTDASIGDGGDAGIDDAGIDDAGIIDAGTIEDGGPDAGPGDGGVRIQRTDWTRYEARRIYRSAPRTNGELGFDPGSEVLTSDESWEGGLVQDPWAVVLPDGRARLYYAAEGGIGVAEAASIDGTFARSGDGRVIDLPGARRPSVVRGEGLETTHAFLLYLEIDGTIRAHGSADGMAWTELATIELEALAARDERDATEESIGAPGVVAAQTEAGRAVLRMYYESRRDDGQVLLTVAGSFDGVTFDNRRCDAFTGRCNPAVPVFAGRTLVMPAPRQLDPRITLLYMVVGNGGRGAIVAGIAPAGVMLPAEP